MRACGTAPMVLCPAAASLAVSNDERPMTRLLPLPHPSGRSGLRRLAAHHAGLQRLHRRPIPDPAGRSAGAARGLRLRNLGRDLSLADPRRGLRPLEARPRPGLAADAAAAAGEPRHRRGLDPGRQCRPRRRHRHDLGHARRRRGRACPQRSPRSLVAARARGPLCRLAHRRGLCGAGAGRGRTRPPCPQRRQRLRPSPSRWPVPSP